MSVESLRVWAESTVQTGMTTNYPSVPMRFENASFLQPDTTWATFIVLDGKSFLANIGTLKVDRHVGLFQFDVMLPINSGTSLGGQIAQFVGDLLRARNVSLSDGAVLVTKSPQITNLGIQNGFYRIMCRVPYWRDEPPQ
jgi:hypothetical protein